VNYSEQTDFAEKRKYVDDLFDMLRPFDCDSTTWRTLEVGGEGGVLAGLMAARVAHLTGTDIVNYQTAYEGGILARLKDKFERNGEYLPLERLEFLRADAQELPFRDDWFDFCFSQNAFEHIPDPEKALRELVRVTRPGGLIYLMFDPLWTADSGSHFLHFIGEPWAHLIKDDDEIERIMLKAGAAAADVTSYRQHMNRRSIAYYREMFTRTAYELGLTMLIRHEWSGCVDPAFEYHPNIVSAAAAHGLSPADLLVRGLRFLMRV
jgi:SAM-dependent methyltransferase